MYLLNVICFVFLYNSVLSAPASKSKYPPVPSVKALDFMKQFGYIENNDGESEALYTEEGISGIIKTVQKFGAIEETGKIDNATLKLMSSPRCGVPDVLKKKRRKRYLAVAGWEKRTITYYIVNWSPKLTENDVVKNIQKALDAWGGYGRLTFRRSFSPSADILVAFGRSYHGDQYPFDGPGNVLAHAFFPYEESDLGGDIHFDDDENWTVNNSDGTDFYSVALHELGHSLGLAHSPVPTSVMFPYYKGSDSGSPPQLDYDDILGMYKLYVSRTLKEDSYTPDFSETGDDVPSEPSEPSEPSSTVDYRSFSTKTASTTETYWIPDHSSEASSSDWDKSTQGQDTGSTYDGDDESVDEHKKHDRKHNIPDTNSPSMPDICDGHVDAMAILRDELFVFREQYIWRFRDKGKLAPGYPVTLWGMFRDLPKNIKKIDAAYQRPDGMIVLFTGQYYWVFDGTDFIEASPRPLTDYGLPSYLRHIDAVQNWAKNGKTYFYKNERFWRYNETAKSMDPGYPLHMERWRGVPENLDAAATWKGTTYFFKDDLFWKFDNDWIIVSEHSPLPTAQIWLGCPEDYRMRWHY